MANTKKLLSKADIMQADDIGARELDIPEWKGTIKIKCMTGTQRAEYENEVADLPKGGKSEFDLIILFLSKVIVDENLVPLFTTEEVNELGKKNFSVIERIFKEANSMNILTSEEIENLAKN